jgi:deoxyinosine 3'endonuclease (endonuclease V)
VDYEEVDLDVPYAAGFLGFREVPAFLRLLRRPLSVKPQCLLVDGFGKLHPRQCGSASHLGVLIGIPTIGVGKNLLAVDGLSEAQVRQDMMEALQSQVWSLCHGAKLCHDGPGQSSAGGASRSLLLLDVSQLPTYDCSMSLCVV